ncbi:Protein of unknown function DUF229 [Trinorchestia longiramus]|nr:Protein of unknown function DUF229 [Trinorchestia longiramus]
MLRGIHATLDILSIRQAAVQTLHQAALQTLHQAAVQKLHQAAVQTLHQAAVQTLHQAAVQTLHQAAVQTLHQAAVQTLHQAAVQTLHQAAVQTLHQAAWCGSDVTLRGAWFVLSFCSRSCSRENENTGMILRKSLSCAYTCRPSQRLAASRGDHGGYLNINVHTCDDWYCTNPGAGVSKMATLRLKGPRVLWLALVCLAVLLLYIASSSRLLDVRDRVVLRKLVDDNVARGSALKLSDKDDVLKLNHTQAHAGIKSRGVGDKSAVLPPGHIACQRPHLLVHSDDVMKFFHAVDPLQCDAEPDWVSVRGSVASISKQAKLRHGGDIKCTFTEVLRLPDDDNVEDGDSRSTSSNFTFTASDFAKVSCSAADGEKWSSVVAGVRAKAVRPPSSWSAVPDDGLGVSVMALAVDSLSHNTFIRSLPKTYKYLKEALGAEVLDGYNIVGDGTAQALIPMLTGRTELELPETRRRVGSSAQKCDVYPLVWKDFQRAGFMTLFAEDLPDVGTFNYRLRGFDEAPAHHYMRPYYLAFQQQMSQHPQLCVRARPRHQVFLDYLHNFMVTYRDQPSFAFALHGELSHDDVNLVSLADDDLTAFLVRLRSDGLLDNTLFMLFADHGHRFTSIRSTQQGKQEERLPFVSFVVPEKIKKKFPAAYQNLRANTERLVTPFDLYATFADILHYKGAKLGHSSSRAISLFSQIPASRTCSDAFIEPHWCACLTWEPLPVTDARVQQAAAALVHYINSHTAAHRGLCLELSLLHITWAAILLPNAGVMAFKQNADMDGFVPNLEAQTPVTEEVYEVHISTSPGGAQYEASLTYSIKHNTFSVRMSDISRTNRYGTSSKCILNIDSSLSYYCVCPDLQ